MKRIIFILVVIALILCLICCANQEEEEEEEQELIEKNDDDIFVWTDEKTGVQYIIYSHGAGYKGMGGITPRLNADGTLYIGE